MRYFLLLLGFSALLSGCGTGEFSEASLPEAVGKAGELVIICDDAVWEGRTGEEIKKTYASLQPGMPQAEAWFKLIRFDEGKFNSITRKYRNILFITTLDNQSKTSRYIKNLLGEKQYSQQLSDSNFLFVESSNRWARGQQIFYLIGENDKALSRGIVRKRNELLAYLNKKELDRMSKSISSKSRNKALEKSLNDSMQLRLSLPPSYQAKVIGSGFSWIGREDADKTLSIFIGTQPYRSEVQFSSEALLTFKDSLSKANILGPLPGSWYTTEYLMPPDTFVSSFNNQYALQMRGLWKVENDFMGGPFFHLTVYDKPRDRLISLEGFVYYPKEKKRELLRELEAIISTLVLE
ncbi:MAG: DUF4837 family protein [Bacteroidia bacterium]